MNKKIGLFLLPLATIMWLGLTGFNSNTGYGVGDSASDFKLKNVDGNMVSMADYKDAKGMILVFTCNDVIQRSMTTFFK